MNIHLLFLNGSELEKEESSTYVQEAKRGAGKSNVSDSQNITRVLDPPQMW